MLTGFRSSREKLLRAALALVARDGFAAATTAAIAEKAGLAEGTLYRHFPSKDDLLIEAYRVLKAEMSAAADECFDSAEPAGERLARIWRQIYEAYRADPEAFLFSQRFSQSELAKREGGEASQRFKAPLARLHAEAVSQGALRPASADLFITMFLAGISAMLREELAGATWTEADLAAAARSAADAWRPEVADM